MMGFARRRNKSRGGLNYFLEFVIIIAGITVSFLLNEWRETEQLADKKIGLLHEIQKDLARDSARLAFSAVHYQKMQNSHDSLLKDLDRIFHEDSLDIYLDHTSSYFPFEPTIKTFLKMTNDPSLSIGVEDSLLEEFMILHNQLYPYLKEWTSIDKKFVLDQLLPYMDLHAPFYYPPPANKSYQGRVFYELKKEDAFLNYMKTGQTYKSVIAQVYAGGLASVSALKKRIDQRLSATEDS
jgi:hypothetical protein